MKGIKHYILILVIILQGIVSIKAQDTLFLKRKKNNKIVVKIEEVKENKILFSGISSEEKGEISINRIDKIILLSGDSIVYHDFNKPINKFAFKRNTLSVHLTDYIFGNFCLSYQRLNKKGTFGIRIPLSIGFTSQYNLYWVKQKFGTGIGLDIFPTGQGKWKYFYGAELRYVTGEEEYRSKEERKNFYYAVDFFTLMVNNGFVYNPSEYLNISVYFGLGLKNFKQSPSQNKATSATGWLTYSMGYRF